MVPPQLCDPFSRTETCKWHNLRFNFRFDELAKQFQPWMESLLFGHRCHLQWKAESNSNFQPGWTSTETRQKRSPTQVDSFVRRNRFNWAESFRFKLKYETENNRNIVIITRETFNPNATLSCYHRKCVIEPEIVPLSDENLPLRDVAVDALGSMKKGPSLLYQRDDNSHVS